MNFAINILLLIRKAHIKINKNNNHSSWIRWRLADPVSKWCRRLCKRRFWNDWNDRVRSESLEKKKIFQRLLCLQCCRTCWLSCSEPAAPSALLGCSYFLPSAPLAQQWIVHYKAQHFLNHCRQAHHFVRRRREISGEPGRIYRCRIQTQLQQLRTGTVVLIQMVLFGVTPNDLWPSARPNFNLNLRFEISIRQLNYPFVSFVFDGDSNTSIWYRYLYQGSVSYLYLVNMYIYTSCKCMQFTV